MTFFRQQVLRSASAIVALPFLESIGSKNSAHAAEAAPVAPKRFVFLGFGFGVTGESWLPDLKDSGANYTLPAGLAPLKKNKADFSIVQNCHHQYSNEAHWGSTFWLTGANRYATPGASFSNTISVDQVAARQLGKETRFPSLQLTSPDAENSGHGPGLSLSWNSRGKPMAGCDSPIKLFHRLFSAEKLPLEERQKALDKKVSVLDTMMIDAKMLKKGLNKTDQHKLDEYFDGIRDVEQQLQRQKTWLNVPKAKPPFPQPHKYQEGIEEMRLMNKLMVAAMQSDSTRVITYRLPLASLLKSLGISLAPHDISHYSSGPRKDASEKRDLMLSTLFSEMIDHLKASPQAQGTSLFDHTTLVLGSNIHRIHYLDNCPTLIAGKGSGIRLGQHQVMPKNTPLCNVWLSLLNGSGISCPAFGDSTITLDSLFSA